MVDGSSGTDRVGISRDGRILGAGSPSLCFLPPPCSRPQWVSGVLARSLVQVPHGILHLRRGGARALHVGPRVDVIARLSPGFPGDSASLLLGGKSHRTRGRRRCTRQRSTRPAHIAASARGSDSSASRSTVALIESTVRRRSQMDFAARAVAPAASAPAAGGHAGALASNAAERSIVIVRLCHVWLGRQRHDGLRASGA
jgi:hypothetical protein